MKNKSHSVHAYNSQKQRVNDNAYKMYTISRKNQTRKHRDKKYRNDNLMHKGSTGEKKLKKMA